MDTHDKPHWYDGAFYELFLDPALAEVRTLIRDQIEMGSSVLDVGCGTGALVFSLAEKCRQAVGIDLSKKMIDRANDKKNEFGLTTIEFRHANATILSETANREFDYATISMAVHEMPRQIQNLVILGMKRVANKIIIADYLAPQPANIRGFTTWAIEFLAGRHHFQQFRQYQQMKGLDSLLERSGLKIVHESHNKKGTIRVVTVQ